MLRAERRFRGLGSSLHSMPHSAVAARGYLVPLWSAKVDKGSVHARARRVAAALEAREPRRLRRRETDKTVLGPRAPYPFLAGYTPFLVKEPIDFSPRQRCFEFRANKETQLLFGVLQSFL